MEGSMTKRAVGVADEAEGGREEVQELHIIMAARIRTMTSRRAIEGPSLSRSRGGGDDAGGGAAGVVA